MGIRKGCGCFERPAVNVDANFARRGMEKISLDAQHPEGPLGGAEQPPPLEGGRGVCGPAAREPRRGDPGALCWFRDGKAATEGLVWSIPNHRVTFQEQPLSCTLNPVIFCLESCVPAPAACFSLGKETNVKSPLCLANLLPNSRWSLIIARRASVSLGVHGLQDRVEKQF